jgi:hypothetical protein
MSRSNAACEKPIPSAHVPTTGAFVILLLTLWSLNLADLFQTVFLKESGFLAQEANFFVDFFLREGRAAFFLSKVLALVLISSILIRGWFDKRGVLLGNYRYDRDKVRSSIHFLLVAGVIYYIVIVAFPFIALALSGLFTPVGEAAL